MGEVIVREDYLLFAGHKEYNVSTYRAIGAIPYLQMIFKESIIGWLPPARNEPSVAWGEIRLDNGLTLIMRVAWNEQNKQWEWSNI